MKILGLVSLWQLFKWTAVVMLVYAIICAGIPPEIICLLLLIRLALLVIQLVVRLIGGLIQIAIILFIIMFLTLIF